MRSVWVMVCFWPEGRRVQAGPRHTPSRVARILRASRWAGMVADGSGGPCARTGRTARRVARSKAERVDIGACYRNVVLLTSGGQMGIVALGATFCKGRYCGVVGQWRTASVHCPKTPSNV